MSENTKPTKTANSNEKEPSEKSTSQSGSQPLNQSKADPEDLSVYRRDNDDAPKDSD